MFAIALPHHDSDVADAGAQRATVIRRKPVPGSFESVENSKRLIKASEEQDRKDGNALPTATSSPTFTKGSQERQVSCYCGTSQLPKIPSVSIDTTLSRCVTSQRQTSPQPVVRVAIDRGKQIDRSQLTSKALKQHLQRIAIDSALAASSGAPALASGRTTGFRNRGYSSGSHTASASLTQSSDSLGSDLSYKQWPLILDRPGTHIATVKGSSKPSDTPDAANLKAIRVSSPSPTKSPSRTSIHGKHDSSRQRQVAIAEHTCRFSNCGSTDTTSNTLHSYESPRTATPVPSQPGTSPRNKSARATEYVATGDLSDFPGDKHEPTSFFDDDSDDEGDRDQKSRGGWRRPKVNAMKRSSSSSGSSYGSTDSTLTDLDRARVKHGGDKFLSLAGGRSASVRGQALLSHRLRYLGCGMLGQSERNVRTEVLGRFREFVLCAGGMDEAAD